MLHPPVAARPKELERRTRKGRMGMIAILMPENPRRFEQILGFRGNNIFTAEGKPGLKALGYLKALHIGKESCGLG
jgi:hypothetical protein